MPTPRWRSTDSWISQHTSNFGYSSTAREVTVPVLRPAGMLDWLVTDQRLVTRQQDGQVTSIYWSAINGLTVDLAAERVVLDGTAAGGGPFHGELLGPAVAPIGVAAIACCYGPQALLDHPALAPLRVGSAELVSDRPPVATIKNTRVERPIDDFIRGP